MGKRFEQMLLKRREMDDREIHEKFPTSLISREMQIETKEMLPHAY